VSEAAVFRSLQEIGERNALEYGRARVTIFDGSSPEIWPFETGRETSVLITMAEFNERPEKLFMTVSPYRINASSPLAGVKSCNYLENLLSLNEARRRGFNEAVRLHDRGEIASACMANIFWERDGRLFTPSLQTGCLRGTTRDHILSSLPCSEVEFGADDLAAADNIFLTSAGLGVVRVSSLDERIFPEKEHPILGLLPGSA
jgi:branched-subunit amino acid aminotransferase/4-amino-4-deoxychorismate lyase